MPSARRLAPFLAALALAACAPRVPGPDLRGGPEALLERVRATQARVKRVAGTARVKVESPGLSGTITERLAAERPDRVRLETLDFFGNPAAVLVASGGRFAFLDARENVLYRGAATPENVSRLLPFVIPLEELVTIVCGSAPILPGRALEVRSAGDKAFLVVGQGELGQQLTVGPGDTVLASRLRRAGAGRPTESAAYDLELSGFREHGGVLFPREVRLDAPSAKSRLALSWRDDLEVNGARDDALFEIEVPRGARVVDLDRQAPPPAGVPGPPFG